MRIALHSTLRPGAADDYLREHASVPDDLVALFERAGIRDWTIWRSGDHLFHLVECDDFEAAMRVIRSDEADSRWQAHVGEFVEGFLGPDGRPGYVPLHPVWGLEEQRGRKVGTTDSRPVDEGTRRVVIDDMGID